MAQLPAFLSDYQKKAADKNTRLTTPEMVIGQMCYRMLARQFGYESMDEVADTLALIMWSYQGQSRREAVDVSSAPTQKIDAWGGGRQHMFKDEAEEGKDARK